MSDISMATLSALLELSQAVMALCDKDEVQARDWLQSFDMTWERNGLEAHELGADEKIRPKEADPDLSQSAAGWHEYAMHLEEQMVEGARELIGTLCVQQRTPNAKMRDHINRIFRVARLERLKEESE